MTTNITELAQREKFEAWAEECNALPLGYLKKRRTYDGFYSEHTYTSLWAAWKAASAELVEALEKAQAGEKQWREVVDAFCADDADWHKLTNSNNELIALLSQALCKQADRIADLESRAVKLVDCDFGAVQHMSGGSIDYCHGFVDGTQNAIRSITAAGIKVEVE